MGDRKQYFLRSLMTGCKAAGVLPLSIYEGQAYVLLGAEPCKTGPGGKYIATMCEYERPAPEQT